MTKRRSREDLAWLAGFWDGEGCVSSLNTNSARNYPVFALSQAGREGLELCERVARVAGIDASISGPVIPKGGNQRQPQWKVRISGYERVQALLAMCWPWLSRTKREQAVKALRAFHAVRTPPALRTQCPKRGSAWVEPNIVWHVAARGWRCRVCRRKNPESARPNGQHARKHVDKIPHRPPPTHDWARVTWS
jgi:hypothetical protein